ncbi:hypothetical protein CVT24_005712 [Panaeolus cyanescens]|uniref:Uncharacterized protein n=1 Tax=Panaeolus cyanescens TaxID=181874 RepID=A0A409WHG4_9AGAR|nr:hypothetical protein CVT24_005712 [Panaeolus cyanescens]
MSTDPNPTPSPRPKWASRMGTVMRRATMAIPSSSSSTSLALDAATQPKSKDDMDTASIAAPSIAPAGKDDDAASVRLPRNTSRGSLLGMGLRRQDSKASLGPSAMDEAQGSGSAPTVPVPPQAQGHDDADRVSVRSKETSRGMFGLRGRRGTSSASVDRVEAPGAGASSGKKKDDGDAGSVRSKSPGRNMFGMKKKSGSSASLDRMATSPLARPAVTGDAEGDGDGDSNESGGDKVSVRSKSPSRSFLGMKIRRNTSNVSVDQAQAAAQDSTDRPVVKKKTSRTGSLLTFGMGKKNASKASLEITPPGTGSSPSAPGSRAPTPPLVQDSGEGSTPFFTHAGYTPSPIAESPMREAEALRGEQMASSSLARQAQVVYDEPEEHPNASDPNADAEAAFLSSPTDFVPPPVIDSTAGNPGAFMDDPESLPQPTVLKDPWGVGGSGHADWVAKDGEGSSGAVSPDGQRERGMGGGGVVSPVSAIPKGPADDPVDTTKGEAAEYYNPTQPPAIPQLPDTHHDTQGSEIDRLPYSTIGSIHVPVIVPMPDPEPYVVPQPQPQPVPESQDKPAAEPQGNPAPEPQDKPSDVASPPSAPDMSLSSPLTYEPSPEKRYGDYEWSERPVGVDVPVGGEAIYVDPGVRGGVDMPHPEPYTTFSPHDEHAYAPTIPSETSPLMPHPPPQPVSQHKPDFFTPRYEDDDDVVQWDWDAHRLMSGTSYFVRDVQTKAGVKRVVTDLDMGDEWVRREVGEFVRRKFGGVVGSVGGDRGRAGGGARKDSFADDDGVDEVYVKRVDDPRRVEGMMSARRRRERGDGNGEGGDDDENTGLLGKNLKAVKKGKSGRKKRRRTLVPKHMDVLFLEMWSVDHGRRYVGRWPDEKSDYVDDEVGDGGYGTMGDVGWGKGKSTIGGGVVGQEEEDAMDSAYRYWLYVDLHPSHASLPPQARDEALEILNWAWTDGVLPSSGAASHFPTQVPVRARAGGNVAVNEGGGNRVSFGGGNRVSFAKPPPLFAQDECEELKKALMGFESDVRYDSSYGAKRPSLSISTGRSTPSHGHSHSQSNTHTRVHSQSQSYPASNPQAQNRLIARIFLRLLGWRETHFRADMPLPVSAFDLPYPPLPAYALNDDDDEDVERARGGGGGRGRGNGNGRVVERRQSVFLPSKQNKTSWASITRDFIGLVLCLGIPYLFVKRAGRRDGESGTGGTMVNVNGQSGYVVRRGVADGEGTVGMFVMWGITCVLAATTLSLSIVLLTLPGSDPSSGGDGGRWSFTIPRVASLVAVVFAVASLVASGVVIWRHSHEHAHNAGRIGQSGRRALPLEGVVVKETLIPSLPIVFLAYAIMALVFAVVMILVKNGSLINQGFGSSLVSSNSNSNITEGQFRIRGLRGVSHEAPVKKVGECTKLSFLMLGGVVGGVVVIGYVVLWG